MKIAVITSHYQTPGPWLDQCRQSVRQQTVPCTHFLVNDGDEPLPGGEDPGTEVIQIPRPHGDMGNAGRAIACVSAICRGFDALAYLDSDNWYLPDHLESLLTLHRSTGAVVCTSGRVLHRVDGTPLGPCPEVDGEHFTDTNCLFITSGGFAVVAAWYLMPRAFVPAADRFLWHQIKDFGLSRAHSGLPTVAYRTRYRVHYEHFGVAPPPGAKDVVRMPPLAPAAAGVRLRLPTPPEAAEARIPATNRERTRPDGAERPRARPAAVSWVTPVPAARARVSLCMIVKDEEAHLGACLASARDLVDEIVVVDTGSADRTKEVAASLGARVYDFAWVDSFAAARNESLRHATGDWIFWLDADERLDEDNRRKLRTLLAGLRGQNVGYLMSQRSVLGEEGGPAYGADQVRLFPRHPAVRWQYRVHEQILPAIRRQGGKAQRTPIVIEHVGYQDGAVRYRKHQRNLGPLQLDHAEHPDNAFILFNLGWTYKELGQHAAAASCLRQCLERAKPQDTFCRKLYALLTQLHQRTGKKGQALAACRAGRALFPDDTELGYLEAMLLCEEGHLAGAEACSVRLLEAPPQSYIAIGVDAALRGFRARYSLGVVYRDQGKPAEAERQWRAVLAERPEHIAARIGLVELWLAHGRGPEAEQMAQELEGEAGRPVDAALVRAKVLAARQDYAAARGLLEETIAQAPQALWPRLVLSHVLLQEGRDAAATEQALRDVLALDPNHAATRKNLAVLLKKQGQGLHADPVAK